MQRLSVILVVLHCALFSISAKHYLPNVSSYDKNIYNAGRQNWDIAIDDKGVVYFANSEGLLCNIYGEWHQVKTAEGKFLRAVHVGNDTIWCGGAEIGYFSKRNDKLQFQSIGHLDGEQVWDIDCMGSHIIFQTENKIGFYNKDTGELSFTDMPGSVWTMGKWENRIWIAKRDGYIGYLSDQAFKPVAYLPELTKMEVRKMFAHNNSLYLIFFEGGVFRFDGEKLHEEAVPESIKNSTLFTGLSYDNESICLGTVSSGFVCYRGPDDIVSEINATNGLIDNTVLSMACDKMGNVWLGLDFGIARAELQSAVNYRFKGAATYTVKAYQGHDYLGTNKGIFRLSSGSAEAIDGVEGQIWKLRTLNDQLYICHNRGLYRLVDGKAKPVVRIGGFLDFAQFKNSDYYVFSTYHGLILMKQKGEGFIYIQNLNIWGNEHLAYDALNNCIWAEIRGDKMYKLTLDESNHVYPEEFGSVKRLFETHKGLYFMSANQLMQYENNQFKLTDDPLLDKIAGEDITALDYSKDGQSVAYIQGGKVKLKVLLPDGNSHAYDAILQSLSDDIIEHYQYIDINKERFQLATDRGLVAFDLSFHSEFKKSSQPVISSVSVLDEPGRHLFFPFPSEGIYLGRGNKNLSFRFGMNKSNYDVVEFRYRLLPDGSWSEWSKENSVIFSHVKGGVYTFSVQSRLNGSISADTELRFTIDKLWYQTAWVLLPISVVFFLMLSIVVLLMSGLNKRKMNKQKREMLSNKARESLQLKNEQLLQYTEIISHKNEFLIRLKEGLEAMRNKEAQRWVNLITGEVNNEKKEFLFHKLFSEVQQDFINRLTEVFPSLTSNDIRILSYIRINLDKKEITNLMNITSRSLDTNRYRLRKKLELDQNTDLDQFIRNF